MAEAKKDTGSAASILIGAAFLMATSAIGPGFLTQTAVFTNKLKAAFAFAILVSILIDIVVQLNIWRILGVSGKRAQDVANQVCPGLGYFLAFLVALGGLVFNIGNVGGAAMGLNVMLGLPLVPGAIISAVIAIALFLNKEMGKAMDMFTKVLGVIMIAMVCFMVFKTQPPIGVALKETILPSTLDWMTILTLVGGTVGGYITYSGAHRLLDKGLVGAENLQAVTRASLTGIAVTGIMRFVLFLAILGVVASGVTLDLSGQAANPAAQAFAIALGDWGMRIFGLVFWAAAITSVIGAAYTSVSFLTVFTHLDERKRSFATVVFIFLSLLVYVAMGTAPAAILVFVGGFNGLILPLGLTIFMYIGWTRADLLGGVPYPKWLLVLGSLVCLLSWYMAAVSIKPIFAFIGL